MTFSPKFEAKLLSDYCRKRIFVSELLSKKTYIMATLSLTILPAKALKGGRHKVRIAVAHNSQTRYIVTDVVIDSAKEWKNGKIVKRDDATYLNTKLLQRMQEAQRIIDELPYVEGLSCAELVASVMHAKAKKTQTLASAFEEMLEVSTAKETTKEIYRSQFRGITSVIPSKTLVSHVTPLLIQRFIKKRSAEVAQPTLKNSVALLAQLLKFCQANGYTDFRTLPTNGYVKHAVFVRQNWLTPDEVRFIRDNETDRTIYNKFRDIFMLSYYLGGINLVDLAKVNFNECKDTLKYIRTKTERTQKVNPYVEFSIPAEAQVIIEKYKAKDGHLNMFKRDYKDMCHGLTYSVLQYRKDYKMPNLTFYSARKSFAQHAFALGENESVIDYILGHSLGAGKHKMLYSYIKVTPDMASEAIRKVCDFIASDKNF